MTGIGPCRRVRNCRHRRQGRNRRRRRGRNRRRRRVQNRRCLQEGVGNE